MLTQLLLPLLVLLLLLLLYYFYYDREKVLASESAVRKNETSLVKDVTR